MSSLGLVKSNGQDISRKGKSKNLMVILPSDFAFLKGTEGILGYFVKLESSAPELVIETEIVSVWITPLGQYHLGNSSISGALYQQQFSISFHCLTAKKESFPLSRYYLSDIDLR